VSAASKRSYPGLNVLILVGLLAGVVGCVCIGVTVLRANAGILPVVSEQARYLTINDRWNVYATWYGAGVVMLCVGFATAAGAIVAKIRTAGRFSGEEAGRIWVGIVGPAGLVVLSAGILSLPVIVEMRMRGQAEQNAAEFEKAHARTAQQVAVLQQQKMAEAEVRGTEAGKDIDSLTNADASVRIAAIIRLEMNFDLMRPNAHEPYLSLRARLLATLNDHWKQICTSDDLATHLHRLYLRLDPARAALFFNQWQAERLNLLDPKGAEWQQALSVENDPAHIQLLKRYCDEVGKSAIATDREALMLYGQAVNRTNVEAMRVFLDGGMPVDAVPDGAGGTGLTVACERGATGPSFEMLKLMLAHGADPNARDANDTALMMLVGKGNLAGVNALLEAHGDPNLAGGMGETPLFRAVQNRKADVVDALLKHGANPAPHASNYDPILFTAVQVGDVKIIESLLKAKADPNEMGRIRRTALSTAVDARQSAIVALLLKYGANPNLRDRTISPPLSRAVGQNDAEMVKALVDAKAEVNVKDPWGKTALMSAVQNRSEAIVGLLIAGKADVNVTDMQGQTALVIAATSAQVEVVRKLLDAHADPNIKDVWGQTVLDHLNASATGDEATIASLLKAHGAVRSAREEVPAPRPRQDDSRGGVQSM